MQEYKTLGANEVFVSHNNHQPNTDQRSRKVNEVTHVWNFRKATTQRVFEKLIFRVKIFKMGSTAPTVRTLPKVFPCG